jgi:hypothetical protein
MKFWISLNKISKNNKSREVRYSILRLFALVCHEDERHLTAV